MLTIDLYVVQVQLLVTEVAADQTLPDTSFLQSQPLLLFPEQRYSQSASFSEFQLNRQPRLAYRH